MVIIILARGESFIFKNELVTASGIYSTNLIDSNGCDSLVRLRVTKKVEEAFNEYYLPNVFTPNGDGTNDIFKFEISSNAAIIPEEGKFC